MVWPGKYNEDGTLFDVYEGNLGNIYDDFKKLPLARARPSDDLPRLAQVRWSEGMAERLARRVREFNGSRPEDAWLLAGWERSDDEEKGGPFRYFTIETNAAVGRSHDCGVPRVSQPQHRYASIKRSPLGSGIGSPNSLAVSTQSFIA